MNIIFVNHFYNAVLLHNLSSWMAQFSDCRTDTWETRVSFPGGAMRFIHCGSLGKSPHATA